MPSYVIWLGTVQVQVDEENQYLATVFEDGSRVPAKPHDTDAYRATAADHGYGTDTWAMCLDHEIGHTICAQRNGLPYSPTLWAVAHGQPKHTSIPGEMYAEEEMVLAWQRWKRFRHEPCNPKTGHGICWHDASDAYRSLLLLSAVSGAQYRVRYCKTCQGWKVAHRSPQTA